MPQSTTTLSEGANDEASDMDLDVWAGVLPLQVTVGEPLRNDDCKPELGTPASILNFTFDE